MKKSEIENYLWSTSDELLSLVISSNEELFYKKNNNKWSVAENVAHLSLSAKLMTKALNAPKIALLIKFGINLKTFRNEEWLLKTYYDATLPATTGFEPRLKKTSTKEYELEEFKNTHKKLIKSLEKWPEWTLDRTQLPHVVYGKLRLREYLIFICFHIKHHKKAINTILETK